MLRQNKPREVDVMPRPGAEAGFGEKERMRNQINAQVEEFLRQGGKIQTCDQSHQYRTGNSVGETWQGPDEMLTVIED